MSKDYIKKSSNKVLSERREYSLFGDIQVYIKEPLSAQDIDMSMVIKKIEKSIPRDFTYGVELILIGQFDELDQRGVKAAFLDGAIYVTNNQSSEADIYDDIVHEIAHSVEKTHGSILFSDGKVISEYLGKKERLMALLVADGEVPPPGVIGEIDYNQAFDEYLHFELGYEKSGNYVKGLFIDSYAAVSLSEYFATAFESYYVSNEGRALAKISPAMHEKIEVLTNYVTEEY